MTTRILEFTALIEESIAHYALPQAPENLYDPLRYFMAIGGKRIRPVLTLMAAELFSADPKQAIHASLGIELFHNFTLIHDDIMDAAPLRRNKTTVHTQWNTNIAILSGDVLMIKAYQEICKQSAEVLPQLMTIFNQTAVEVCEGQQMDMDFETLNNVSIEQYIEMIRLKTSVLLGCALEMGAIIGKANQEDRAHIYNFGQELGLAFQIKDDILDLYGDPEKFGKQIGGDVMANKKTLLYLLALEKASEQERKSFALLETETNMIEKVEKIKILFNRLGVPTMAQKVMDQHKANAMASLAAISCAENKKEELLALSNYLMNREN